MGALVMPVDLKCNRDQSIGEFRLLRRVVP